MIQYYTCLYYSGVCQWRIEILISGGFKNRNIFFIFHLTLISKYCKM